MSHQASQPRPIVTLFALLSIAVLAAFIGALLGQRQLSERLSALCDSGETFYRLGVVDTPYRCARVIDFPPTTGATE